MPNYRRLRVPGATWFFTVNLADRSSDLLVREINRLRLAVKETKQTFPFEIDAMVVLPDHLHAIMTLPEGDADYAVRWRWIKARFSRALPATESRSPVQSRRGERGIWQRRFWEHLIRDERDFALHVDYCHFNPLKHGLVENVKDWPFSSFHRDMDVNRWKPDLAKLEALARQFGERG